MKREGRYLFGPLATAVIIFEAISWAVWLGAFWLVRTQLPAFQFARPSVLWWMFGGLVLFALYLLDLAWKNRALARFADADTSGRMVPRISSARSFFRFLFIRHGLSFALVALAGPQMGTRQELVKSEGVDVMVALDVSNSMLCEDLRPSRMEVAKRALERMIDGMQGDRIGIVVFAGQSFVQLPITSDRSSAKLFLSNIGPGMVNSQGTAIGDAITTAQKGFGPDAAKGRAIIVITDGENHEDDAEDAAKDARAEGIVVNTIGMGTPEGGPIPMRVGEQITGFKKDKEGNTVITKLDEDMLQRIAAAGNGRFVRATQQDSGIDQLLGALRGMDQTETAHYRYAGHEDRYRNFLAVACVLIFAGLMMGERRGDRPKWMTLNT